MSDQLKSKTLHSLFWSFLESGGREAIQFVISIILARLLLPEQFGLIAMLAIFMTVAQSFIDSGFGAALIQKQDASRVDESSIFYFNIAVGLVTAGLLCLAAPWIASFYKIPQLALITRILSLNLIINPFCLVQISLLTKRLDFRTQMKISMTAMLLSGGVGIAMAYQGFGVWSLVAQSICSNVFRTALLWMVYSWKPMLVFSYASLRSMFAFGSKLFMSGLLETTFNNIYLLVIGKVYSPIDLGFYSRAKRIVLMPTQNIFGSVAKVTFPAFSAIQGDKPRLKRGVSEALKAMSLVNFPLMIGLAVCAKPLVRVLLTDKWLPTVPYLQLLCFVGLLYPLHVIHLKVLTAQGRSDLYFRLEIIKKLTAVVAIALTYRWGIIVMIYGQIAQSAIGYYLNSYYTGKLLKYPITEQIVDFLPTLGLAALMGGAMFALNWTPIQSLVILLSLQVATGVVLFTALSWIFKLSSFVSIVEKVMPRLWHLLRQKDRNTNQ